jgi:hypothetical protein
MLKNPVKTPMLPAVMLLMLEWLVLLCVVWTMGAVWLLPLAALCVFCALLCLGRAWLAVLLAASTIALIIFWPQACLWPGPHCPSAASWLR